MQVPTTEPVVEELTFREAILGLAGRFAVEANVGDGVEPLPEGGVEGGEAGEVQAVEEVLLHIADARFNPTFLVGAFDRAGHGLEAVVGGEVQVAGMELGALSQGVLEDTHFEVVNHDPGGNGVTTQVKLTSEG
jgi:hypothetical protein